MNLTLSNYFDPRNGIWIAISGIAIWNSSQSYTHKRRRRKRKRPRRLLLFIFFTLVVLTLVGCGGSGGIFAPSPTVELPTPTCTPTNTPGFPSAPTDVPGMPGTPTNSDAPSSEPPSTPDVPQTPTPPPTSPPTVPPTIPPTVDPLSTPFQDSNGKPEPASLIVSYNDHPNNPTKGIDVVPKTKRRGGGDAIGFSVIALRGGLVSSGMNFVGPNMVAIKEENEGTSELVYSHIIPRSDLRNTLGFITVAAGDNIGEIMDIRDEDPALVNSLDSHLHIQLREPAWSSSHIDPTGLISSWGDPGFIEP